MSLWTDLTGVKENRIKSLKCLNKLFENGKLPENYFIEKFFKNDLKKVKILVIDEIDYLLNKS